MEPRRMRACTKTGPSAAKASARADFETFRLFANPRATITAGQRYTGEVDNRSNRSLATGRVRETPLSYKM